ncbi:MAG: polysaccharide deacetylase [Oscillospiraceae bacterium]|nr:polysaccharide deacetylase [Oscillospiraceae bacterium]
MYLGSVRFFKHLILSVVALFVIVLLILAISLSAENADLKKQIESLGENVPTNPNQTTPAVTTGAEPSGQQTISNSTTTPVITTQPPPSWPPVPSGEYAELFPDLYAENDISGVEYIEDSNYIYFTFDDGPTNTTLTVLNELQKYGVKATFFVVPKESTAHLLKRVHEAGHSIGVHSFSHDYPVIYSSVEAYLADFKLARDLIYEQTGVKTDFFRFPGGSVNDYNRETRDEIIAEMTRRGFVYFDWTVESGDIDGASWDRMYGTIRAKVAENAENGRRSIILFHDTATSGYMTWVIDDLIEDFQANPNGYVFGQIDGNTRPMQW